MALKCLLEGMSIRATARLTDLDKDTVQRIMEQAGRQCLQFMADTMQDLPSMDIQVDEIWSFIGMKEKTAFFQGGHEDLGDCYTFTAIDRESKLLICYHCGQRTGQDADRFSQKPLVVGRCMVWTRAAVDGVAGRIQARYIVL